MYKHYVLYIHICSTQCLICLINLTAQLFLFLKNDILRNTHLILNFIPGAQLCMSIPHLSTSRLLWYYMKRNQFYQFKGLNSVVSTDWTMKDLHLICNSWKYKEHFFKLIIQHEITYQDDLYDDNDIPVQFYPSPRLPYAYVQCSHFYCLLLGEHIQTKVSSPVPQIILNPSQL